MTTYTAVPVLALFTFVFALGVPLVRSYVRDGTVAIVRPHDVVQRFLHAAFAATLIAYGLFSVALAGLGPEPFDVHPVPASVGAGGFTLAGAGLVLVVVAQAQMGRSWRIGIDTEPTGLVTHGVFRLSRNPIYLGLLLVVIGLAIVAPSGWTVMGAVLLYVEVGFQARAEEQHLQDQHGEAFTRWATRVGRFLPGLGLVRPLD